MRLAEKSEEAQALGKVDEEQEELVGVEAQKMECWQKRS